MGSGTGTMHCVNLPRVQTLELWLDKNSILQFRYTVDTNVRRLLRHGRNGAIYVILGDVHYTCL